MGKTWLSFVSCFSHANDKKNHKKPKKRWFGKQKSKDSIPLIPEEVPSIKPSATSPPPPQPTPAPAAEPQPSLPQPPPAPAADPQPWLPPPSPPLPPPFPSTSARPPAAIADSDETTDEQTRQALALATAVATEAAIVAAHAAAEVVRLTTAKCQTRKTREESAAIKIQTAYRGYKARRTLRTLRGTRRLKELLQGRYVKRQATSMLRLMQTLTHLQTQVQERGTRLSEENKARHRLLQQNQGQKEPRGTSISSMLAGEFDVSKKTKEQVQARLQYRKEAAVRRERALAYAYSHQQTWRNSSKLPHNVLMDPNNPQWGWNWLDRWMASRPWDSQTKTTYTTDDDQTHVKKSSVKGSSNRENARPRVRKTPSRVAVKHSEEIDSKNIQRKRDSRSQSHGSGAIKEDESVGSSATLRGSLGPKKAVAKPKGNVSQTTSNLSSEMKKKKKEKGMDDKKVPIASAKKKLPNSAASSRTRRGHCRIQTRP